MTYDNIYKIYDLMHNQKDYKQETEYIKKIVNSHSSFKEIQNILDFGCGTCSHLKHLAENKRATGIDISYEMIEKAKLKKINNLSLYAGDIRDYRNNELFDLCISMFHVFNHFDSIGNLDETFGKISNMLKPESLFIFDSFNSVAVFRSKPADRSFEKDVNDKKYVYNSSCSIDYMNSRFTMHNDISYDNVSWGYDLTQYLWTPFLYKELLLRNGFEVLGVYKNSTLQDADVDDYKACFVARKL